MHNTVAVLEDLFYVGASDRRLSLFENVYPVPRGASYNSYLLLDEKTALFDTVDHAVSEQFLENVEHVLGGRKLETLVLLSHKEPDSHISVNIEFGEGEGQISLKEVEKRAEARKPKEKVTYKMIQQYIEENYGFKVHTAYIAEVKRSLGLPMYDAPNVVEELKHPRPHPTKRMVAAIKETLAHFDFI